VPDSLKSRALEGSGQAHPCIVNVVIESQESGQPPRNRLAVGSLTTGVPESPRKKSGRRCRIGAEVFVAEVRGRPRRAPQMGQTQREGNCDDETDDHDASHR
jgi:hypothetical protein